MDAVVGPDVEGIRGSRVRHRRGDDPVESALRHQAEAGVAHGGTVVGQVDGALLNVIPDRLDPRVGGGDVDQFHVRLVQYLSLGIDVNPQRRQVLPVRQEHRALATPVKALIDGGDPFLGGGKITQGNAPLEVERDLKERPKKEENE